jgi:hypothetical protein
MGITRPGKSATGRCLFPRRIQFCGYCFTIELGSIPFLGVLIKAAIRESFLFQQHFCLFGTPRLAVAVDPGFLAAAVLG